MWYQSQSYNTKLTPLLYRNDKSWLNVK